MPTFCPMNFLTKSLLTGKGLHTETAFNNDIIDVNQAVQRLIVFITYFIDLQASENMSWAPKNFICPMDT